jgi:hypothetical protein
VTQVKIYAEIEVVMDVDSDGLAEDTLEYEVQQKKPVVYRQFVDALEGVFGEGLRKIDYLEFDVIRRGARGG